MDPGLEIKDFVSMAVCGLCDSPRTVQISMTNINDKNILITIFCSPDDRKRVVGKDGKNITSVRTVAQAMSAKHKYKLTLLIDE